MRAERISFVSRSEQAPFLQDRNDMLDEAVEHLRQHRGLQVEAVGNAFLDPVLNKVGDLLGRAFEDKVAARPRELGEQLAQRRVLLADISNDDLGAAARRLILLGSGKSATVSGRSSGR